MAELRGLRVYTKGELTVATFEDEGFAARRSFLSEAAEHLERIAADHHSKVLVIDLAGITALPSDVLGTLVGLHHRGTRIRLFNPTDDVRFVLDTMNLDQLFDVREGDLSSLLEAATEQ